VQVCKSARFDDLKLAKVLLATKQDMFASRGSAYDFSIGITDMPAFTRIGTGNNLTERETMI
jgi:hypothetical protein